MRATILGSAAGGGFPQWNCGCPNCRAVREARPGFEARTQDSLAVHGTDGGDRVLLVNASPDILSQIQRDVRLWPRGARHSPISAIVLTNGDLDHVLGLFSLRESWPLSLYVTSAVRRGLEASAFIRTLRRFEGQLVIRELPLDEPVPVRDASGEPLGLEVRAFPLAGKLPVHFVGHAEPSPEDAVGLVIRDGTSAITYAAACATADVTLPTDGVLLFDGTFYREDELVRLGLSKSHARDMAHVPIAESMHCVGRGMRRIYTHINNTNPILAPDTEERRAVLAAGWEIAFDGMEITP
jgi:pyrroloquinoline quinone biosynthesis protein B